MTVEDGYELAEILQSDAATAQIPIIFVTAAQIDESLTPFGAITAGQWITWLNRIIRGA